MISYFGEWQLSNIQECEPVLRAMMADVNNELNANDYRNGLPDIARNAQIVETSKNLLWFVTFSIQAISDCAPLSEYAKKIPSENQLGTELYYGLEVMDEVVPGTITRGFMCMKCAGADYKTKTANDTSIERNEYTAAANSAYKAAKTSNPSIDFNNFIISGKLVVFEAADADADADACTRPMLSLKN